MNRLDEIRERCQKANVDSRMVVPGTPEYFERQKAMTALVVRAHQDEPFLLGEIDALIAEVRRLQAELRIRKQSVITPICTCGGHGYEDDDDEDFWCPVCHAHLGTHRGFKHDCPRCGQTINGDGEPIYQYRDMLHSEEEWRGPAPDEPKA